MTDVIIELDHRAITKARAAHTDAMVRAMDAAAAVGAAENRLAAAREEIIAANSALIFAREHEAAVLPLVASTYEELQRLMETQK